jgi:hypothetical protein
MHMCTSVPFSAFARHDAYQLLLHKPRTKRVLQGVPQEGVAGLWQQVTWLPSHARLSISKLTGTPLCLDWNSPPQADWHCQQDVLAVLCLKEALAALSTLPPEQNMT